MKIINVDAGNVGRHGFFCYMSKRKSPGYQRKLQWLEARFSEGMRIKLLELPDQGRDPRLPEEQVEEHDQHRRVGRVQGQAAPAKPEPDIGHPPVELPDQVVGKRRHDDLGDHAAGQGQSQGS